MDILVQSRRNKAAAKTFFRKVLKGCQYVPRVIITDKLASYGAAKRENLVGVEHRQHRRLNNRAENSHHPTRQRERGYPMGVAPLQVTGPCSTLPLCLRPDPRALLSTPAQVTSGGVPPGTCAPIPGLERGGRAASGSVVSTAQDEQTVFSTTPSASRPH